MQPIENQSLPLPPISSIPCFGKEFIIYEQHLPSRNSFSPKMSHQYPESVPNEGTRNDITDLRKLRDSGAELNEVQKDALRRYYTQYKRRKVGVHLKGNRESEWRELASLQGTPMSSWIQNQVVKSLEGSSELVKELRHENQSLQDEVSGLRGTSGSLAVENSKLQSRIESMESNLIEALDSVLRLEERLP
jgi:FtsZ-binding cell division protein ZapB